MPGVIRHGPDLQRRPQVSEIPESVSLKLQPASTSKQPLDAPAAGPDDKQRQSLRPLLALKPYLLRHRGKIAWALLALVVSAMAMLAIPMAVRRMIDVGFSTHDGVLINRYFEMLIVIGLVLAVASGARFYFVNWLG
jgi:ATP-binding cassette subfamily B protein